MGFPIDRAGRRAGDPAVCIASSAKAHEQLEWAPQRTELQAIVRDAWEFECTRRDTCRRAYFARPR